MKIMAKLDDLNLSFTQELWSDFLSFIPKFLLAIGFVILAWITIRIVNFVLKKLLGITKIDSLTTKLNEAELFGKNDYDVVPSKIILKFIKYLLVLIFIIIASEILNLRIISEGIGNFIAYIPVLLSALLIFVLGVYIASVVKKAVKNTFKSQEINGSNLVSNIVFYAIVVVVSITALNHSQINTEIITTNLTLILGSVLIAFTIAFGLGSKDVVTRLLFGFYSRKNFEIGQHIRIKKIEGVIEQIDNICITIKTEKGIIKLPIKHFVDQKVEVL